MRNANYEVLTAEEAYDLQARRFGQFLLTCTLGFVTLFVVAGAAISLFLN
jgi:hypothetical protein